MLEWSSENNIPLDFINILKLIQSAFNENFKSEFKDKFLNQYFF